MKETFQTQITIRLYDTNFAKLIDDSYKASGERFESKNHYLTEILKVGFAKKQKESCSQRQYFAEKKKEENSLLQMRQLIEDLHVLIKQYVQELLAYSQVSQKLSSAIYNLLVAFFEDERLSTAQLEAGFYDDLPERLAHDLGEFLKRILKKQPE